MRTGGEMWKRFISKNNPPFRLPIKLKSQFKYFNQIIKQIAYTNKSPCIPKTLEQGHHCGLNYAER